MSKVAETILDQLGRNKFIAMTGARWFTSTENSLSFQLPNRNSKNHICGVRIVLNANDTYDVSYFKKVRGTLGVVIVSGSIGVHACDLQRSFTEHTGLDTHL